MLKDILQRLLAKVRYRPHPIFFMLTAMSDQRAVVQRMKESGIQFNGTLSFFNDWDLFWDGRLPSNARPKLVPTISRNITVSKGVYARKSVNVSTDDSNLEQLTNTGPFSGRLGSFATGVRLRTRYHHLLDQNISPNTTRPTTYWASGSERVIETARHFALGFFGIDWETDNTARLEVISEKSSLAADTLTPGRTCPENKNDLVEGKMKGYRLMGEYRATYLPPIRERLHTQTGLTFTDQELFSMQEMCGFETTVRGRSPWCSVFTRSDFLAFEYARDLLHYYRAGPGQRYAAAMGWLWLNATTNLLLEGPAAAGPFFFSFVHDGDIAPMMTALDVISDDTHLPTTHIAHARKWRKSQVSPMGGRVIFELLSCEAGRGPGSQRDKFVRLNINDGITALPDCHSGPGKSCPLAEFAARTKRRGQEAGDFKALCGLGEDAADRITFLHQ
jgi:acid phosphatase